MIRFFSVLLLSLLVGCATSESTKKIYVSIEPLRWAVGSMVDSTVTVEVLVQGATSPESFEPSARQVAQLYSAELYFGVNLFDFEKELFGKVQSAGVDAVNLSSGISLLKGECSAGAHNHGVDPHIWLSPIAMREMVLTASKSLDSRGLLDAEKRDSLLRVVDNVHSDILTKARQSDVNAFAIIHPSLGYYARDYSVEQIPLERDGKEPSARSLATTFDRLNREGINRVLYSSHDSKTVTGIVSGEENFELVPFEPLSSQWSDMIMELTGVIYGTN